MIMCPNFNNPDVAREFEELKNATNEAAAYHIWSLNNGNAIDKAPNGAESQLFSDLLKLCKGDRQKAIYLKSIAYTNSFIAKFGDWIKSENEPTINQLFGRDVFKKNTNKPSELEYKSFSLSDLKTTFGGLSQDLLNGESISSNVVLDLFNDKQYIPQHLQPLYDIINRHNIPVKYSTLVGDKFMTTVTDEHRQSIILINPQAIGVASNGLVAQTLMHEIIHALTVPAINNPKNETERQLAKSNRRMWEFMDKLYPADVYDRLNTSNGMYALCNEKEFVAEFVTNKAVRDLVYEAAIRTDQRQKNTLLGALKRFINAITKFFVNKEVFSSKLDEVKKYEAQLNNYLLNRNTEDQLKYKPSQLSELLHNQVDDVVINGDEVIMFNRNYGFKIDNFERNNALQVIGRPFTESEIKSKLDQMSKEIAQTLHQRLVAIKASNLSEDLKIKHSQILTTQIQQFTSDQLNAFQTLSSFLSQVLPQLLEDSRKMRDINSNNRLTTDSEYMYQLHDNFNTYRKILTAISTQIDNDSIAQYLANSIPESKLEQQKLLLKDLDTMRNLVTQAKSMVDTGVDACHSLLIRNIQDRLGKIGVKTGSFSMASYLEQLKEISYDTSKWFAMFGSIDKAKDDALRTLFHLVDKAIENAEMKSHRRITELMKLQEALPIGQNVKDLYEIDNEGFTTGYLIRKYNYGQFFKDYNQFLKNLNVSMGIVPSNRTTPEGNLGVEWNKAKNEWLSEHCERRFTKEYYEAYSGLSTITRQRREEIQSEIRSLKDKALGSDGYYHFEKLSSEEFGRLQDLYIQKRILKSNYNINGEEKTGVELQIAQELQELDRKLSPDKNQQKKNFDAWNNARIEIFNQCGGKEEYDKGSEGSFDFKRYRDWMYRNGEIQLKRDEDGKILLMKKIYSELKQEPVYEINNDGGITYENVKKERNELLNMLRDFNNGDIKPSNMTKSMQAKLKDLEKQLSKIRKQAKAENKQLKGISKQFRSVFKKYAKSEKTTLYKRLTEEAIKGGYLAQFQKATGKFDFETGEFIAYKWFTKLMPQDEYFDEFAEWVPGSGWTDHESTDQWLNKDFDESENMSMVPKKSLYDNSKKYYKLYDKDGKPISKLGELHQAVLNTMQESNVIYSNRNFHDDYLLPQIPGSLFKRMRGKGWSGKWGAIRDYVKDGIGINDVRSINLEYGQSPEDVLNQYDEFGEIVPRKDEADLETVTGRRPDGRDLHLVPQYYTRRLADPSQIASDLCGIVAEYYKQALTFQNKQEVKDTCESIVDMIEGRNVRKKKVNVKKEKIKDPITGEEKTYTDIDDSDSIILGKDSNTYGIARNFLNTHLYNIRSNSSANEFTLGAKTFKLGKFAQVARGLVAAINLGGNLMVALTGFITSAASHLVQQIVGHRYNLADGANATLEQIHQMFLKTNGVHNFLGNKTSTNKMMVLAETFNISNQLQRKYTHSNRNRLVNIVNENWCFGQMSACDFLVKSNIMLTVLMSYRHFRGRFMTEEDMKIQFYDKSKAEMKELMKEWKNGTRLYDTMSTEDGTLHIKEEFQQAYDRDKAKIHARISKWSEDADGMATPRQKAAITTNIVGASILIHRQYLPLTLQSSYANTVYDMDTEEYNGGVFRSVWKLISMPILKDGMNVQVELSDVEQKQNKKISALAYGSIGASLGIIVDNALISSPMSTVGILAGAALGIIASLNSRSRNAIASQFNNRTSMQAYAESRARLQHIKQVSTEIALYHLMIQPFVNALCAFADDDDDDKDKIAFAIVTYLMSLLDVDSENLGVQMAAFLGRRFQWEFYTRYRIDDMFNNFKTVSAQFGLVDALEDLLHQTYKTVFPNENLFETSLQLLYESVVEDDFEIPRVETGLYSESETRKLLLGDERFTKFEKAIIKLIPQHHTYEQLFDSQRKRNYYEKQIMRIDE